MRSLSFNGLDPGFVDVPSDTVFPGRLGDKQKLPVSFYGKGTSLGCRMVLQCLEEKGISFTFKKVDIILLENFSQQFLNLSEGGIPVVACDGVNITPREENFNSKKGKLRDFHLSETIETCMMLDKLFPESKFVFNDEVLISCLCSHDLIVKLAMELMMRVDPKSSSRALLWKKMLQAKAKVLQQVKTVRTGRPELLLQWVNGSDSALQPLREWLVWLDETLKHSPHGWVTRLESFSAADAACAVSLNKIYELLAEEALGLQDLKFVSAYLDKLSRRSSFQLAFRTFVPWEFWVNIHPERLRIAMNIYDSIAAEDKNPQMFCELRCTIESFLKYDFKAPKSSWDSSFILDQWFRPGCSLTQLQRQLWFCLDSQRLSQLDKYFAEHWKDVLESCLEGNFNSLDQTFDGMVALIIILDQFSRHIYRSNAKQLRGDSLAVKFCKACVAHPEFSNATTAQKIFILMPLEHSEIIDDQQQGDELFRQALRETKLLEDRFWAGFMYYKKMRHEEVLNKYGRFPSRDCLKGLASSQQENETFPKIDLTFW